MAVIWTVLALLGVGVLVLLFVLLTEGRYFGKGLMRWVYDRFGPSMFGLRSESESWDQLAEALQLRGDEMILDVGTATGDLPLTLAARPGFRGRVWGVDWSPRMVALAQDEGRRRGLGDRIAFQLGDIRQGLPFDDSSFDVVCCLGLLEGLPRPELGLAELGRVLKPDGVLVVSLYRSRATRHLNLSLDWYRKHMGALGLNDVQVMPCRRSHDLVIAARRGR